jgi:murein peptide amidase A
MPDWRRWAAVASAIAALVLSGCAFLYQHSSFPEVRDVTALESRVRAAVAASGDLSLRTLDHVTYRGRRYPLWLVSYASTPDPAYHVLITAGVHGDEPAGVEAAVALIEALARGELRSPDAQVDIVPLVNPWGWSRNLRVNGNGLDINRDFVDFESDEADIVKALLCRQRYDLTVDLHESSRSEGFYSYVYDPPNPDAAKALARAVANRGVSLRRVKGNDGFVDVTRPKADHPRKPTLAWYCRRHVAKRVYTLETPARRDMRERVATQRFAIGFLMDTLAAAPGELTGATQSGVGACALPGRASHAH